MKVKCSQTPDEVSLPINTEIELITRYPGNHQRSWDRGDHERTLDGDGRLFFILQDLPSLRRGWSPPRPDWHSYPAALQKGSKTARPGVTYHIAGKNSLAECLSLKVYPVSLPYSPREGLAPQPQPNPLLPTLFLSLGNSTTELYLGTALLDTATLMKTHMRQAWEGNLQESRLGFSEKQEEHRIKWKWENYLLHKF